MEPEQDRAKSPPDTDHLFSLAQDLHSLTSATSTLLPRKHSSSSAAVSSRLSKTPAATVDGHGVSKVRTMRSLPLPRSLNQIGKVRRVPYRSVSTTNTSRSVAISSPIESSK